MAARAASRLPHGPVRAVRSTWPARSTAWPLQWPAGLGQLIGSWRLLLAVGLLALLCAWPNLAQAAVQAVPALTHRVVDLTHTLKPAEIAILDAKLKALEAEKGSQVAVLMVDSTAPEDIFAYSNRVANSWKIGRAEVGDGVLIVVAKGDRRMRIEVAKTLEGAVTDISSGRIVNEAMAPRFRANDYAGGIEAAVDAVSALIRQEPLPLPDPPARSDSPEPPSPSEGRWFNPELLYFLFFAVFTGMQVLRRFMDSSKASLLMAVGTGLLVGVVTTSIIWGAVAAIAALVMSLFTRVPVSGGGTWRSGGSGGWSSGGGSSGGWSSGSSGRSSSGGFSSGGGGSFGGGGASGSW